MLFFLEAALAAISGALAPRRVGVWRDNDLRWLIKKWQYVGGARPCIRRGLGSRRKYFKGAVVVKSTEKSSLGASKPARAARQQLGGASRKWPASQKLIFMAAARRQGLVARMGRNVRIWRHRRSAANQAIIMRNRPSISKNDDAVAVDGIEWRSQMRRRGDLKYRRNIMSSRKLDVTRKLDGGAFRRVSS